MAQLGHSDPKLTLRVDTHLMRRDPAERRRLKALVDGEEPGAGAISSGQAERDPGREA